MASTLTASLALATFTPSRVHTGTHVLQGQFTGAGLSASASSSWILLAKIPPDCTVSVVEMHSSAATTQVLNIGIRAEAGSTLASAIGAINNTKAAVNLHGPYTCVREETTNEKYKYVVASLESGSPTASMQMKYQVIYSVGVQQG